jgi:hypothetical protein
VLREIDRGYDRTVTRLEFDVLPVADVLGISLPLERLWRDERNREEKRLERSMARWNEALVPVQQLERGFVPAPVSAPAAKTNRVGRNDPCPCGSGKTYKKCCGRNT